MAIGAWGAWRIGDGSLTRQGTPIRVGLVQGNIEQTMKWRPEAARAIFTTYVGMTREVARRGAQYVIWPESSTPFTFEGDPFGEQQMRDLARELKVPILFGSDQVTAGEPAMHYNAAFQLAPDGTTAAVYRKIHLVPFGEFVPLSEWMTVFPPLVQTLAGFAPFSPGDAMVMLPLGGHLASTAICYEVVYPSLVRQAVLDGSQLLTTITNDAWYGQSSAPFQHFAMASMRAIEHGRYLARAANTGISGVIDPYGRVVASSAIFEQVGTGRGGPAPRQPHDLHGHRRCRGVPGDGHRRRLPSSLSVRTHTLAIDLDDFERRYDELRRRAAELRRYL